MILLAVQNGEVLKVTARAKIKEFLVLLHRCVTLTIVGQIEGLLRTVLLLSCHMINTGNCISRG